MRRFLPARHSRLHLDRPLHTLGGLVVDLPQDIEHALVAQIRPSLRPVDERLLALGSSVRPTQDFFGRQEELERLAGVLAIRQRGYPSPVWTGGWKAWVGHLAEDPRLLQDERMVRAVGHLRTVFGPLLPDVASVTARNDHAVDAAAAALAVMVSVIVRHLPVYLWLDDAYWMANEAGAFGEALSSRRPDNVSLVITMRQTDVDADLDITLRHLSEDAVREWRQRHKKRTMCSLLLLSPQRLLAVGLSTRAV